ncbi:hypothetical protein [Streptomyces sp. NPDC059894]|uniref:hypothetical protein n=1 Tax=unclassified Streptomyces TaxID=2593676 RepID=UPI00364F01A4
MSSSSFVRAAAGGVPHSTMSLRGSSKVSPKWTASAFQVPAARWSAAYSISAPMSVSTYPA